MKILARLIFALSLAMLNPHIYSAWGAVSLDTPTATLVNGQYQLSAVVNDTATFSKVQKIRVAVRPLVISSPGSGSYSYGSTQIVYLYKSQPAVNHQTLFVSPDGGGLGLSCLGDWGAVFNMTAYDDVNRGIFTTGKYYFNGSSVIEFLPPVSDTQLPPAPGHLRISGMNPGYVELIWDPVSDASTGNSGIYYYKIYRDGLGKEIALSQEATFTDVLPSTAGEQHTYQISAVDRGYNESAQSAGLTLSGPRFQVGDWVYVTKTGSADMRVEPSLTAALVAQIPSGAPLQIFPALAGQSESPAYADGEMWWHVWMDDIKYFPGDFGGWMRDRDLGQEVLNLSAEETAVLALIQFSDPAVDVTDLDVTHLTPAQVTALQDALAYLSGKKFMIFEGEVLLLDEDSLTVTVSQDVVTLNVFESGGNKGSLVLADLKNLNTPDTCEPSGHWYNYLNCMLKNFAKSAPGALFEEDETLIPRLKSYLDVRYSGGFDNNFDLLVEGATISISPKVGNSLPGIEGQVSMNFTNDPLVFDKSAISQSWMEFKDDILENAGDVFLVADAKHLEPLSTQDIRNLINPPQTQAGLPSTGAGDCHLPNAPACYGGQSGSVIPCNKEIDYIWGIRGNDKGQQLANFHAKMNLKRLEVLGYLIKLIDWHNYPRDGFDFFRTIMQARGQVLVPFMHGYPPENDRGGTLFTLGCVHDDELSVSALTSRLGSPEFNCYFSPSGSITVIQDGYCGSGELAWGVHLKNTMMQQKAIHASFACHGSLTLKGNEISNYVSSGPIPQRADLAVHDMILFESFMLGIGPPNKGVYTSYPPYFDVKNNVNVKDITAFGGPLATTIEQYNQFPTTVNIHHCPLTVPGIGGDKTIDVPCISKPGGPGDAHLFPYVTDLVFPADADPKITFSDDVTPPVLDWKIKGVDVVKTKPTPLAGSKKKFWFRLIPEVQPITMPEYDSKYSTSLGGLPVSFEKMNFLGSRVSILDSTNDVSMVGNDLAEITSVNLFHGIKYFLYDPYFWHYNARADKKAGDPNLKDMRKFKARVPYLLHPWVKDVKDVTPQGSASHDVDVEFSIDMKANVQQPCQELITVDASQCTNQKKIFTPGGLPQFKDSRNIQFSLINDVRLIPKTIEVLGPPPPNPSPSSSPSPSPGLSPSPSPSPLLSPSPSPSPSPSGSDAASSVFPHVVVTIHGGASGVHSVTDKDNRFPLQGNTLSPSFWNYDANKNGKDDVWEGNSNKLPQKEGDFEIWLPCAAPRSACCTPKGPHAIDAICQNRTKEECGNIAGSVFHEGQNCLQYGYYRTPEAGGSTVVGKCPGVNCPVQPQVFTFSVEDEYSGACYCSGQDEDPNAPGQCMDYQSSSPALVNYAFPNPNCPDEWTAYDTNDEYRYFENVDPDNMNGWPGGDECGTGDPDVSYVQSRGLFGGGTLDCRAGGSLTKTIEDWNFQSGCTWTRTVTVEGPRCDSSGEYAVKRGEADFICCALDTIYNSRTGACEPMFAGVSCPAP